MPTTFPKMKASSIGDGKWKTLTDSKPPLKYIETARTSRHVTITVLAPGHHGDSVAARAKRLLYDNRHKLGIGDAGIEQKGGCNPVYGDDGEEVVGFIQDYRFTLQI